MRSRRLSKVGSGKIVNLCARVYAPPYHPTFYRLSVNIPFAGTFGPPYGRASAASPCGCLRAREIFADCKDVRCIAVHKCIWKLGLPLFLSRPVVPNAFRPSDRQRFGAYTKKKCFIEVLEHGPVCFAFGCLRREYFGER